MPPKVVITFEGILLLIRKIVLHLMVDSTDSTNCSMIENNPQKGVSLSDLICIFAMSIVGFSYFFATLR